MFAIPATSPSGALNSREYWMKAVTCPSDICPAAIRRPPTTAMPT